MNSSCIILLLVLALVSVCAQDCSSTTSSTALGVSLQCGTKLRIVNPYGSTTTVTTGPLGSVTASLSTAGSNIFGFTQSPDSNGIYVVTLNIAAAASTTSSKSAASSITSTIIPTIMGVTASSHLLGNSWKTTALTAVSCAFLLTLPHVTAACTTSATLAIIFPSGTVVSQDTSNPAYTELTITNVTAGCSTASPTNGPTGAATSRPSVPPTRAPGTILRMQDTSIRFGSFTPAGFGSVPLSSMDNYAYGTPFYGLGLLQYGSVVPQNWSVTQTKGEATHWVLPALMVAEGSGAVTPKPSAAGVAAQLNGGPYVFLVQAYNASGLYDSATLTITIQTGAANIGSFDALSSFTLNPAADTILLSTGVDKSTKGLFFQNFNFTRLVTFKNADDSKPAGLCHFNCKSCNNWVVSGFSFTGDLNLANNYAGVLGYISCTNMYAYKLSAYFDKATQGFSAAIGLGGCVNCFVDDFYAFGLQSGLVDNYATYNANVTISRLKVRQYSNNAMFLGNSVNLTIIDCVSMAAMRTTGFHIDHLQVSDGASPQNLKIIRLQQYKAESTSGAQGIFGGGSFRLAGFVDDGSGNGVYSGKPGYILTFTVLPNTYIYGKAWIAGDNFPVCQITRFVTGVGLGQATLQLDSPIAAPLGNITNAPFTNFESNGYVYVGNAANVLAFRGLSNSLITAFTAQMLNPIPAEIPISYFTATIIGNVLTVVTWNASNVFPIFAPTFVQLSNGSGLVGTGSGLVTTDFNSTVHLLGTDNFNYPTPTAFRVLGDVIAQPNQGPRVGFSGVDSKTLYTGKTVLSNGYMWNSHPVGTPSYLSLTRESVTATPSWLTLGNSLVLQKANATFAGECFAQGDPQFGPEGLEKITNSEWAAMSFAEVISTYVAALTPKVGGHLTSGGIDFGAFTRNGLWNDGSGKSPVSATAPGSY